MRQENGDIVVKAARFVKGEIQDTEEALQGAQGYHSGMGERERSGT